MIFKNCPHCGQPVYIRRKIALHRKYVLNEDNKSMGPKRTYCQIVHINKACPFQRNILRQTKQQVVKAWFIWEHNIRTALESI